MKQNASKRPPENRLRTSGTVETLGAFEAKTHLARLLRETSAGKSFIITHRGQPVAELHPPAPRKNTKWGDLKDQVWVADDFCEPDSELEEFFS